MRLIRVWLARRAIRRLLAGIGWPDGAAIFSGNVTVTETVYDECAQFSAWYVETCGSPR